jgi:mono/diheme cytochrome c family protein
VARGRRRGKGTASRPDWLIWVVAAVVGLAACVLMALVVIPAITTEEEAAVDPADAPFLYERHCGTCHGLEGQGNIGPQLADGAAVAAYPDIDDQIQVITDGRDQMPPFDNALTDNEIRAIAEYTRGPLGADQPAASTTTAG